MIRENNKTCGVIGAGVSGLAAAIRMRNKGYRVTIFEANNFAGGKLSSESVKGYRFDMGPSVFTMPGYVDELFRISGKDPRRHFNYIHLDPVYRYFFEDGTVVDSYHGKEEYARQMAAKLDEKEEIILRYLSHTEEVYHLTADVFLYNSLHKLKNFFRKSVLKGLLNFGKIGAFETMNEANEKAFRNKKMVQIFNRPITDQVLTWHRQR
jgi:phytoene dehydrogenase-like protein